MVKSLETNSGGLCVNREDSLIIIYVQIENNMSVKNYSFIKQLGPGLVITSHPEYGDQLWSIVRVRKNKDCLFMGYNLKGKEAYMPVTNLGNRMVRISKEGMQKLTKDKIV